MALELFKSLMLYCKYFRQLYFQTFLSEVKTVRSVFASNVAVTDFIQG